MTSIKEHGRQYDLVIFGATGYTGRLTAEYVAKHVRTDLKWAIAGRSQSKLQALAEEVKQLNPDRTTPGIEMASLNDAELTALAKKTCVLVTTVGPYALYGEHAVKACAETGTHYVDVTGEAPWVLQMIKKYEDTAKKSGALMFPQSGIESAPADLLTWTLAQQVQTSLGVPIKDAVICVHHMSSTPSGGSLASGLALFDKFSFKEVREAVKPFAQSPIPHAHPRRAASSILSMILGVREVSNLGILTTSVVGPPDYSVVERSWGLLSEIPTRKDQFYGTRFASGQYWKARNWLHGIAIHWFLVVMALLLALVPPCRTLAKKFVSQPGQGAEKNVASQDEVEYRGVALPDSNKFGKQQAYGRAHHHGGMYYATGILLIEAALTILEDDIGIEGGFLTPACLGQGLIDRLDKAGFKFEVRMLDG